MLIGSLYQPSAFQAKALPKGELVWKEKHTAAGLRGGREAVRQKGKTPSILDLPKEHGGLAARAGEHLSIFRSV